MRYRMRTTEVEALAVLPLTEGVRLGALSLPVWLRDALADGTVRIRPDAVEVALPSGIYLVAGPNDLLVRLGEDVFTMRTEWFARLFEPVAST